MAWHGLEGHDEVRERFRQILASGRLAHAYLFLGPSGIGKKRFALLLAQALQCETRPPEEVDPCEQCSACRQVAAGTHPDVTIAARPEDRVEFPIETVRTEIIRPLGMKPTVGRYRIVIVDDADSFNEYSANALLKTLEEPPARSLLILISTSPELMLPTILSRCQQIWFRPLSADVITRILLENSVVEDEARARYCAELAEGSVAEAMLLASDWVQEVRDLLIDALSRDVVRASELLHLVERTLELGAGGDSAARREVVHVFCRLVVGLLRTALRVAVGSEQEASGRDPRERAAVQSLAVRLGPDRLMRMIERTIRAAYHNDRRVHVGYLLEAWACAVADIANPPPLTPSG